MALFHVTVVVVLAACQQSTPKDAPKPKPPVPTPLQPVCPTTRPEQGAACIRTQPNCSYAEWTCECGQNGNWMCSNCIAPDTTKPCVPGDHCEQHNWERDELYTCQSDGKWSCYSSSSNSAACAGIPRHP